MGVFPVGGTVRGTTWGNEPDTVKKQSRSADVGVALGEGPQMIQGARLMLAAAAPPGQFEAHPAEGVA